MEEWVNAYRVQETDAEGIILFEQLVNRMPLPSVVIQNNIYVTAQHCVFQNGPF